MPDWLKEQPPSAVEELINRKHEYNADLIPSEVKAHEAPAASAPVRQQQPPPPKPVPQEKPKSPEPTQPTIAPSRSFVLPGASNVAPKASPVLKPQPNPSSSDSDDAVPEKPKPASSYNTLLELLKPKKIEVSTDSSDSDATELVFGPKSKTNVTSPPSKAPVSTTAPPVKPPPAKANDLLSKLKLPQATTADSDDDFFN
uniref:WASH complex subunit 1 n=1 Tax=Panagrellus redivivus TaxID=6233 RepID=A0A7E4VNG2_PANRE